MTINYSENVNILKEKAITLRKKGYSYNEINRNLKISKSTLSGWFKNENFSRVIKANLIKLSQKNALNHLKKMALTNKIKWEEIHSNYRKKAKEEFSNLVLDPLFTTGLVIYWGEGDKRLKNGILRIANTDYLMLSVFIRFLNNIFNIPKEKIRLWLLLYPDLKENECKEYWSNALMIPQNQFIKSQFIIGKEKKKRINHGVCYVQIYSRELKEKILVWINLYGNFINLRV